MPILKSIPIHATRKGDKYAGVKNCIDYTTNNAKTEITNNLDKEISPDSEVAKALDYASNLEKTVFELDGEQDLLVSGHNCNPNTAALEFQMLGERYAEFREMTGTNYITGTKIDKNTGKEVAKESREAYHLIQSFENDPDLDPRLVHQIGMEFLERAFPEYKATCSTHMNTDNLHNHLVICAYRTDSILKYRDTMDNLNQVRQISDELSLKYGIPIILSPEKQKTISWLEWDAKKKGESWKQHVKNDIMAAAKISSSWEVFKTTMIEAGYELKENEKSVTYTLPGFTTKKVRDRILGDEFKKESLMESWGEKIELSEEKEREPEKITIEPAKPKPRRHINIYVSRYTDTGRRRTELELIVLIAIKIIKEIRDKYFDKEKAVVFNTNPIYRTSEKKLRQMEEALNMIQTLDIQSQGELQERMDKVGKDLKHAKKVMKSTEISANAAKELLAELESYEKVIAFLDSIGLAEKDLFLDEYSDKQVRSNQAKITPMDAKQRRRLFKALNDNDKWRLNCKYDDISYQDAEKILTFLKEGEYTERPAQIISIEEYDIARTIRKYETVAKKRDEDLKVKYFGLPITPAQEKAIKQIREQHPDLKINPADMYEASKVISHFKQKNHLNDALISQGQAEALRKALEKRQLVPGRDVEYITVSEYEEIRRYLKKEINYLPEILKPTTAPSRSSMTQMEELLVIRNEYITIPVEHLSQNDVNRMTDYLLYRDEKLDFIVEPGKNEELTNQSRFESFILDYDPETQIKLIECREYLDKCRGIGIYPENIQLKQIELNNLINTYEQQKEEVSTLGTEYKNLARLNYNINLAKNERFTHGPLFKMSGDDISTEIQDTATEAVREEEKQLEENIRKRREEEQEKEKKKFIEFFSGVDEYFDLRY